jgi:hypothetical protein
LLFWTDPPYHLVLESSDSLFHIGIQEAPSVADPDPFDTDPDPAFHFDTDPDPAFQPETDPDPTV